MKIYSDETRKVSQKRKVQLEETNQKVNGKRRTTYNIPRQD